ncbi:hypothetical protein GDO86_007241 [Hymenochirus boettgeri]|uniref:Ssu-2 homolog n=1 Tax=Hymenochirus boettgeri TaxID=247094 RepID=A0A8T2J059_9PIPI|nr:hypothetical protein GDO86_007241 [Hymenochirus boettgeri]
MEGANYGAMNTGYQPMVNPSVNYTLPAGANNMYGPPPSQMAGALAFMPPANPYPMNSSVAAPPYAPVFMDNPSVPLLSAGSPGATAPPSEMFGPLPGYEGIGGNDGRFLPPPPPPLVPGPVQPATNPEWIIPTISEDVAKEAFLEYARSKCCYGTSPATEMVFKEFQAFNTYRYRLETYTESRAFEWKTEPFKGQKADAGIYGNPPQPWDIPVQLATFFKDEEKKIPVPGTCSIQTCPQCIGTGKTACSRCHGTGRVQCSWCHGTGHRTGEEDCSSCNNGTVVCSSCSGGKQSCNGCSGKGKIANFIQLIVTWKNNIFEFVADHNSEFPTDHFKKVNGEKLFSDEQPLVPPIISFPAQSINQASQDALQNHYSEFSSTKRMLRQRQTIELLPLTKVHYNWKETAHSYFVYGKENKVYTADYPQTCCCTIL